jgi:hypothetical protein
MISNYGAPLPPEVVGYRKAEPSLAEGSCRALSLFVEAIPKAKVAQLDPAIFEK